MSPNRAQSESPSWLEEVDIGRPGSRFSERVALAIKPHSVGLFTDGQRADASEVVGRALSDASDEDLSALGEVRAIDGSIGRGAEGWIAVAEWALEIAAEGIIADALWNGVKLAGRQLRDLLARMRKRDVEPLVSRGAAALIAIAYAVEQGEPGILDVEAVTDTHRFAGLAPSELSYVGVEPWLVSLVNEERTERWIVAVAGNGEVLASMRFPMNEWEAKLYPVLPSRE